MEYTEYIGKFKKAIHEKLGLPEEKLRFIPKGYETSDPCELEWIRKINVKLTGVAVDKPLTDLLILTGEMKNETGVILKVNVRSCYETYGDDIDSAVEEIKTQIDAVDNSLSSNDKFETRFSRTYEELRESLILRPLNYSHYAPLLEHHVYWLFGEVALVLYMLLGNEKRTLTTSKIQREEVEKWGVSKDQIFDEALANTARLFPPCVFSKRLVQEINLLTDDYKREDISLFHGLILVSTFRTTNGAVALFYPGVVEQLMKVMGGPFEAVFMNINDVMIYSIGDSRSREMAELAEKNGPYEEMLSGHRYLCSDCGIQMIESETPESGE